MTTIDPELETEFSAIASEAGCELVHAEFKGGTLRVFIDRPDGGVTIDDCQTVSRQVSAFLDVQDFGKQRYTLEVSSPGLDRQLYRPKDYRRFAGSLVRVTFFETDDDGGRGKRTIVGRLEGLDTPGGDAPQDSPAEALPPETSAADSVEAISTEDNVSPAEGAPGTITVLEGERPWRIPLSDIKVARLEIEL